MLCERLGVMKILSCLCVVIGLGLMFVASVIGSGPDKIKITFVSSPEQITRGVETEITVGFEYTLESADEGEINLGFNTDKPKAATMVESLIVRRGNGTGELKAKVVPVDWGQRARFTALVILSKHPHETRWKPLVSDRKVIPVGQ
jgi:hypothetical protein